MGVQYIMVHKVHEERNEVYEDEIPIEHKPNTKPSQQTVL